MKNICNYICREPQSAEELLEIFSLRFKIFKENGLSEFFNESGKEYELDIDRFDLYAVQFGLYHKDGSTLKLIGTMRMVGRTETKTTVWIRSLTDDLPNLKYELLNEPKRLMPLMNYIPIPDKIEAIDNKCLTQGKKLYEISRFAIDKSHKALYLSQFMMESVLAYLQPSGASIIFSCNLRQRALYQAFNNWPLNLTPEFIFNGQAITIIYLDWALLPKRRQQKIKKASDRFIKSKNKHFQFAIKSQRINQNS